MAERREGQTGFTLLEVLVAVAILSISLASLLSSQMASLRATDQARQLSSVAFLAEAQLIEIEWMLKQDGWGTDDQVFEGDFSDEGWPYVEYICVVDLIEMPEYTELVAAKDAADSGGDDDYVQDAGDQAFGALGMAWPIVKDAIEQSIRKSYCTVRWSADGKEDLPDQWLCGEEEFDCLTISTFWTDPEKLKTLPALGGEADETDDDPGGGEEPGAGGGGRGGSGKPGEGTSRNPSIPSGPGMSVGGMGR